MQGSLGEKIGEGAYSEAYAWAPGQVVKLFKPGLPRRMPRFEVLMLRAVDWVSAMRGPAALELGFLHVILSELAPEIADNPERPRATNAAAQTEYARLTGISPAELTPAMEPYLPIVRTFIVLGDVVPSLRERLIQRIEAGLRSED
jgi:hypothetical protein